MKTSMALISDATHNFSDFMAVLISYIAYQIGKKGATNQNTFGYRRAALTTRCFSLRPNPAVTVPFCVKCLPKKIERQRLDEALNDPGKK